jgi:hypothetical protein
MRLVSDNSPEQLEAKRVAEAREDALDNLNRRLRDLSANVLRNVRGAGKPWDIGKQCESVVEAMIQYREVFGLWPASEEISAALSIAPKEELLDRLNEENQRRCWTEYEIIRGALQVAASDLLGQNTHRSTGHNEMFDGIFKWHRLNEEAQAALGRRPARKRRGRIKL